MNTAAIPPPIGVKVSVCMITYNHENFIAQAIESVMMQQTEFSYELVVAEDCSQDNTREKLLKIRDKYPDRIRLILREINMGMIPNFVSTLEACNGKYIAILEGDDYWVSPEKLQKQVDFLDRHEDCVLCFSNIQRVKSDGENENNTLLKFQPKEFSTIEDILVHNYIPACSVMFRNGLVLRFPNWYFDLKMGDWPLYVLLAQHGFLGYIDEIMAAYRVHEGGAWSARSEEERIRMVENFYHYLSEYLNKRYHHFIRMGLARMYLDLAVKSVNRGNTADAKYHLKRSARESPLSFRGIWLDHMVMFGRLYLPSVYKFLKKYLGLYTPSQ